MMVSWPKKQEGVKGIRRNILGAQYQKHKTEAVTNHS